MQRYNPLPREFPVEPLFGDEHLDPRAWNGVVPNVHPAPEEPHSLQLESLIFGDTHSVQPMLGFSRCLSASSWSTCPCCRTSILNNSVNPSPKTEALINAILVNNSAKVFYCSDGSSNDETSPSAPTPTPSPPSQKLFPLLLPSSGCHGRSRIEQKT
ncbi:hypothetical protein L5515_005663 [Caenorhabditis briggsae]|uniref:Uncharacterized protein n=1 Tax=Caenorhabditis briggsae TaxID=6238 RepID=A0AAE9EXE9_CAEBR|nr:hypothetical protein L5515_005663 [Caenorhabditis briggsae]